MERAQMEFWSAGIYRWVVAPAGQCLILLHHAWLRYLICPLICGLSLEGVKAARHALVVSSVFRPARIKWRKRGYAGVFDGHFQLDFRLHRHRSPTDFY
jgi:hypothetical protein